MTEGSAPVTAAAGPQEPAKAAAAAAAVESSHQHTPPKKGDDATVGLAPPGIDTQSLPSPILPVVSPPKQPRLSIRDELAAEAAPPETGESGPANGHAFFPEHGRPGAGPISAAGSPETVARSETQLQELVDKLLHRVCVLESKAFLLPDAAAAAAGQDGSLSSPPRIGGHTRANQSAFGPELAALFASPVASAPAANGSATKPLPPGVTPITPPDDAHHEHSPLLSRSGRPRSPRSPRNRGGGSPRAQHGGGSSGGAAAEGGGEGARGSPSCTPSRSTSGGGCDFRRMTLLDYVRMEIFGADDHGSVDTQVNRTVKNFLSVPRQLERLLFFGLLICLDTFLYIPTFLPLRIAGGVALGAWRLVTRRWHGRMSWPIAYDCMRGAMMAQCLWLLQHVQMSRVYHYIRGQSMIKLYVLIGMVEIFDKLMCSFGQDALDSLYWSTMRSKKRLTLLNFVIVCIQSTLHSLLLFVHITTLTVAVNSSDQALLTLLISNNFAEIKSAVFKKFDKQNLFQLSCHDIVERFKLILFLGMIMLLNIAHGGDDHLLAQFLNIFFLVFGGEVLADWIKHAFITKFNMLQPSLYEEYSMILARDITSCRKDDDNILDHTHLVARRLAFATLPLNCVMIRFLQIAAPRLRSYLPAVSPARLATIAALFYLIALAAKLLTGMLLMAHSYTLQCDASGGGGGGGARASPLPRSPAPGGHKSRKELSLEKLSTIARFTLWRGRIV